MRFFNRLALCGAVTYLSLLPAALKAAPTATPAEIRQVLSAHLSEHTVASHNTAWSCLQLEHRLTQFYTHAQSALSKFLSHLLDTQQDQTSELSEDLTTALSLCYTRYSSLSTYESITRLLLTLTTAQNKKEDFLLYYLNRFHPHTPKSYYLHPLLLKDIENLPKRLKSHETFKFASTLLKAVLRPHTLESLKPHFSTPFYHVLAGHIWKMHFEYARALEHFSHIAQIWYKRSLNPKKLRNQFRPLELTHMREAKAYMLRSNRWLIHRFEWLAKRIDTLQAYKQTDKILANLRGDALTKIQEAQNRWSGIRKLWNEHQTQQASGEGKSHLTWVLSLSHKTRQHAEFRKHLGTLYMSLARMQFELQKPQEGFSYYKKARKFCSHKKSSCFFDYHRNLALAYMMQGQYEKALDTFEPLIKTSKNDAYNRQEIYFWKWVLSRHLKRKFDYDFPYLTSYRQFATCLSDDKQRDPIPSKSVRQKMHHPHLSLTDFRQFLDKNSAQFLWDAVNANESSGAVEVYLRQMSYSLIAKINKGRKIKLSTDKMMTVAKLLQKHDLYIEAIGLLFALSTRTRVKDLPDAFYDLFFPSPYETHVGPISRRVGVPKPLINAFIRRESIYDRRATSPAYALGLMQLLPSTALRVAKSSHMPYKHTNSTDLSLYEAKDNIRLGSQYIQDLLRHYSSNLVYTIAAYNAGEHRVDGWKDRFKTLISSPLLFIENIPFAETRQYVKWVLFHSYYYTQLHDKPTSTDFCHYAKINFK